jgi:hypothetical protein
MSDDDKYLDSDKVVAERLEILKQKFSQGNKAALLMAIYQCALMRRPLPEWLCVEFILAYEAATAYKIRSWDEAFGPPQERGSHLDARRDYAELRYPVALRVALRAPDQSIDPGLFEKIGIELGIGKNKASDAYYKFGGKELAESIEPLVPFLRRQFEKTFPVNKLLSQNKILRKTEISRGILIV